MVDSTEESFQIYVLKDNHPNSVNICSKDKTFSISAGELVIVFDKHSSPVKPRSTAARKSIVFDIGDQKAMRSEFSFVSLHSNSDLLSHLTLGSDLKTKHIRNQILKFTAAFSHVTSSHGIFGAATY